MSDSQNCKFDDFEDELDEEFNSQDTLGTVCRIMEGLSLQREGLKIHHAPPIFENEILDQDNIEISVKEMLSNILTGQHEYREKMAKLHEENMKILVNQQNELKEQKAVLEKVLGILSYQEKLSLTTPNHPVSRSTIESFKNNHSDPSIHSKDPCFKKIPHADNNISTGGTSFDVAAVVPDSAVSNSIAAVPDNTVSNSIAAVPDRVMSRSCFHQATKERKRKKAKKFCAIIDCKKSSNQKCTYGLCKGCCNKKGLECPAHPL